MREPKAPASLKNGRRANYGELFWKTVEEDYIIAGLTFKVLVSKYGVSEGSLSYQSKKRNWQSKREIHQQSVGGSVESTRRAVAKLTRKLDKLDPEKAEDIQVWKDTLSDIRTLVMAQKRIEGMRDELGDIIGTWRAFGDFLAPRCKDMDFLNKLADWAEQWFEHVQKQR